MSDYFGIIPARAGFTFFASLRRRRNWDHPRSRGVYIQSAVQAVAGWGSSPLARGLLTYCAHGRPVRRIIPARAGFTFRVGGATAGYEDHPRSRGVYGDDGEVRDVAYGSSPLARGLRGI